MESSQEKWVESMGPFATAIGMSIEDLNNALKPLVGDPSDAAFALLQSESDTPYEELAAAIGKDIPKAVFRSAVRKYLRDPDAAAQAAAAAAAAAAPIMNAGAIELLPVVPTEEAWLQSLRTGGTLKVDKAVVISGIRAALAVVVGLFNVPKKLRNAMSRQANSLDEPVSQAFFDVERLLVQRRRADVLNEIGTGRRFATVERRRELINRLNQNLLPSLVGFHDQLQGWLDSWQQGFSNPGMLMLIATGQHSRNGLPPNMMAPPDAAPVRDAAESVVDKVNRAFAGLGIPVANAMAVEVGEIQKILQLPELPILTGSANKEQMLKQLGLSVDADYVRLEQNLVRYVMSVMGLANVTGDQEVGYLSALAMLGSQIPWSKLGVAPQTNAALGEDDEVDDDDELDEDDSEELVGAGSGRSSNNGSASRQRWSS